MKFITNDYGCGTSSSILDYDNGKHGIVVSPENWKHVLNIKEDICLAGHDFLLYMWDNEEKVNLWKNFKYNIYVWCFERVDAIVESWRQKSFFSINQIKKFTNNILACDEHDCDKFGFKWLPQWASPKFYEKRNVEVESEEKILFSGQAGKPEYFLRNKLLSEMINDDYFSNKLFINNNTRSLSENEYLDNLLKYKYILNPVGVLESFNVRSFEVLYSDRILLQQVTREYKRHKELVKYSNNCILFSSINELKEKILSNSINEKDCNFYKNNNLESRINLIRSLYD